ncbi:MAG: hypothetical protein ACE5E5_11600 [Phycisphaerae bacterium]
MRRGGTAVVLAAIISSIGTAPASLAADDALSCADCHARQKVEFAASVHGSLACTDCHGGAAAYPLSATQAKPFLSGAVGRRGEFDHGAAFRGKPERKTIPDVCGSCHADVARMNPYDLRTDQLSRYWTSGHGRTLRDKGDDRVAVCVDCHGRHEILRSSDPKSKTYPLNVPDTCSACHGNAGLMKAFGVSVGIVDEYRQSVHGRLLLNQHDTGAPTCATCHGNHSAAPPGFASVRTVCGKCHVQPAEAFASTVHADLEDFLGCVQCHGGGEGSTHHRIERVTQPMAKMSMLYGRVQAVYRDPTPERITEMIHPAPRRLMDEVLEGCLACHEEVEDDESLQKQFTLLDTIADAERAYVRTASRLAKMRHGVLLTDAQEFTFQDARTYLVGLAPLQHTLDVDQVVAKAKEVHAVCDQVEAELDTLDAGLQWRHKLLIPIWVFAGLFAAALYAKFKQLKAIYVVPMPKNDA